MEVTQDVTLAKDFRRLCVDISSCADGLAARGRYHFTTAETVAALDSSSTAVRASIRPLREKGLVAMPFRGFFLVVPPEYRSLGCLPAEQFVPQIMEHLGLAYYVGLLSAASLHGAAHQAPMAFQTVAAENRPEIRCGQVRLQFIARRNVAGAPTERRNTMRGVLRLSTPEATAFDLVGSPQHSGGLSNVATILSEWAEKLDARRPIAESGHSPLPCTQSLGYLLERIGAEELTTPLFEHVVSRTKGYVPLRARKTTRRVSRDSRWRLNGMSMQRRHSSGMR